jgi:PASTA domain
MECAMGAIRGRKAVVVALAAAACSLAATPATAGAFCSNVNNLDKAKSYSGTASASYVSGTLTGPPAGNNPNSATISIDRSASNLQIADLKPGVVTGADFASLSQPTGGSLTVNDTWADPQGSVHMTGSGPTKPGGDGNGVQILANASSCTYQVLVSFGINTNSVKSSLAEQSDMGVNDNATSPAMPIPSNLVLQGSATILTSGGGATSGSHGLFDMSGDPVWGFEIGFVTGGKPAGTAKISWDLNPAGATAGCVVPKVKGLSEKAASKAIKKAGCKLGNVSKSHSKKVAKGKVISSKPKAGSKKPAGTKVALVISSGK